MNFMNAAWWLVIIGAIVHLLLGLGQVALLAPVSPYLGVIQIVIGVAGLYLIAKKMKWL